MDSTDPSNQVSISTSCRVLRSCSDPSPQLSKSLQKRSHSASRQRSRGRVKSRNESVDDIEHDRDGDNGGYGGDDLDDEDRVVKRAKHQISSTQVMETELQREWSRTHGKIVELINQLRRENIDQIVSFLVESHQSTYQYFNNSNPGSLGMDCSDAIHSVQVQIPMRPPFPCALISFGASSASDSRTHVMDQIKREIDTKFHGKISFLQIPAKGLSSSAVMCRELHKHRTLLETPFYVLVEDGDGMDSNALCDLIYLTSNWDRCMEVTNGMEQGQASGLRPLGLVFGMGTSVDRFYSILGTREATSLKAKDFALPAARSYLNTVLDKVFLGSSVLNLEPFLMWSPAVWNLVLGEFEETTSSLNTITSSLHASYVFQFLDRSDPLGAYKGELIIALGLIELQQSVTSTKKWPIDKIRAKVRQLSSYHVEEIMLLPSMKNLASQGNMNTRSKYEALLCDCIEQLWSWRALVRFMTSLLHETFTIVLPDQSISALDCRRIVLQTSQSRKLCVVSPVDKVVGKVSKCSLDILTVLWTSIRDKMESFHESGKFYLPPNVKDTLKELQKESVAIAEAIQKHQSSIDVDKVEIEAATASHARPRLGAMGGHAAAQRRKKMLMMSQTQAQTQKQTGPLQKIYELSVDLLNKILDLMQPCASVPLSELVYFDRVSSLEEALGSSGLQPRSSIVNFLRHPQQTYLESIATELQTHRINSDKHFQQEPYICVAYQILQSSGRFLNIYEWFQAFHATLSTQDLIMQRRAQSQAIASKDVSDIHSDLLHDEEKGPQGQHPADPLSQASVAARFYTALTYLEFLGLYVPAKRRPNHVEKTVYPHITF